MSDRVGWLLRRQPEFTQGVANFSTRSTTQARREHLTMLRALGFAVLFAAVHFRKAAWTRWLFDSGGACRFVGARSFARGKIP